MLVAGIPGVDPAVGPLTIGTPDDAPVATLVHVAAVQGLAGEDTPADTPVAGTSGAATQWPPGVDSTVGSLTVCTPDDTPVATLVHAAAAQGQAADDAPAD